MRKEIVYSLAAVAAIPVVASAAESGATAQNLVIAASGGKMNLTGDAGIVLKAGKYQLFFSELTSAQVHMTATVKNLSTEETQTVSIEAGQNVESEPFTITAGTYSIEVAGANGFTGNGAAIQLLFDFQEACTNLKTILVNYVNEIDEYKNEEKTLDVSNFNKWQGIIDSLGMVNYTAQYDTLTGTKRTDFEAKFYKENINQDDVNAQAYSLYENYKLDENPNAIAIALKNLYDAAKANEVSFMNDSLAALNGSVDTVNVNSAALEELATAAQDLIDKFEAGTDDVTSNDVWEALDELKEAVDNAIAIDKFYKETALPYFEDAQKVLTAEKNKLDNKTLKKGSAALLKTNADTRLATIQAALTELKDSLGKAHADGTLGTSENNWKWDDDGDNDGFRSAVDALVAQKTVDGKAVLDEEGASLLNDTVTIYNDFAEYMNLVDSVQEKSKGGLEKPSDAFLQEHYGTLAYIDSVYKKARTVIAATVDAKLRKAVTDAATALKDTVLNASKKGLVDEETLTTGLPKYEGKLNEAIEAYMDSLSNYQEMSDSIDSLTMRLKAVKDTLTARYDGTLQNVGKPSQGRINATNYEFVSGTVIKDDAKVGFRDEEVALYTDSISKAITDLKNSIAKYSAKEAENAVKATGEFKIAAQAIFDDIEDLAEGAEPAIKKYVTVQSTIDSLYTVLNAFEDEIKNKDIYKKSVPARDEDGNVIADTYVGGYKEKIDSIRSRKETTSFTITTLGGEQPINSSIQKIQDQLDSAFAARGISREDADSTFSWYMDKVAAADTAALHKAIDLLKENFSTDSAAYAKDAQLAAFDNLKKSVRELCDSIDKIITRIEDEIEEDDEVYGAATVNIQEMIDNVKDSLCANVLGGTRNDELDYEADETYYNETLERADEDTPFSETLYNLLGKDADKLQQLLDKLGQVKQAVEYEKQVQAENQEAMDELSEKLAAFLEKIEAAQQLVADGGECEEVYGLDEEDEEAGLIPAKPWYNAKLGAVTVDDDTDVAYIPTRDGDEISVEAAVNEEYPEGSIMASFKKIYEDAKEAQGKGQLVGNTTFEEQLAALETFLEKTGTDSIKARQKSLNTLKLLEAFDDPIQESKDNALSRIESENNNTPSAYEHYATEIDEIMEAYEGTNSLPVRGEDPEDEDAVNGLMDSIYYDYKGDTLTKYRENYLNALVNVIKDLDDVEARMLSNRTNLLTVRKDSAIVGENLEAAVTAIAEYDEKLGESGYADDIDKLLADLKALDLDSLYENGAFEDDSLKATTATLVDKQGRTLSSKTYKEIKRIAEALEEIAGKTYGKSNYAQLVADKALKAKIAEKAEEARQVYKKAVELEQTYRTLTSKTLREAVAKAKELSAQYNEDLKEFPAQINAAADAAVANINAFRTAEETKDLPYENLASDTAAFRTIMNAITGKANTFKSKADAAVASAAKAFVDAFNTALNDSSFMDPTKTPNYIHYADSTDEAGEAFIELIAAFKDKKKDLNDTWTNLSKTPDAIATLDTKIAELEDYEDYGKSYAEVKEDAMRDRAKEDLYAGLEKAKILISKANKSIYGKKVKMIDGVATTQGIAEEDLDAAWEAKKATILGTRPADPEMASRRAVAEENAVDLGLKARIDTIKSTNHRTEYAAIYAILNDFITNTDVQNAVKEQENYDNMMKTVGDLQAQLDAAIADNGDYLAIADMTTKGGYKQAQDAIDALEKKVQNEYDDEKQSVVYDNTDSTKISRLIKIASTLIGDTLKNETADTAVAITKANTLFGMEKAYLENMETKLWTLFNKAAANKWNDADNLSSDELEEVGKPFEDEIKDIFHDIDSLSDVADADKKKTNVDSMYLQQQRIEEVIAGLLPYAGTAISDSVRNELLAELAKVEAALDAIDLDDYEGLTDDQIEELQGKIDDLLDLIDDDENEGEGLKDAISESEADEVLLKEDQFKTMIAALNGEVANLKKEIEDTNAKNDKQKEIDADAADLLSGLQDAIDDMEEAFEKFDNLENDYSNRIALVKQRAAAVLAALTPGLTEDELDELEDKAGDIIEDSRYLVETASKEDIDNIIDDLEERADGIVISENDFLPSDYDALTQRLNNIKNGIARYSQRTHQLRGGLKRLALDEYYFGDPDGESQYDNLKDSADVLTARLDSLEETIEILKNGGELPDVRIVGDIDGDGFVTSDDVDAFLEALQNDLLPDEDDDDFDIYDVNGDSRLNIADAQGIQNLALGMNWDGTVKDVEADEARSTEAPAGNVSVESTQLENGAQRITLMLNGNFDWTGFQMDVKGAEVLAENAQGVSLRTANLKNGAHRIVAFGANNGNGQVITIDVQGNAQLGTITFTTPSAQAISFKLSGTTGIYGISTEKSNTIYDLGGKLMNGMKKGVNIIRDAAGKAKKALMK